MLGICDVLVHHKLDRSFPPGESRELRQSPFSCCFDVLFQSGFLDRDEWAVTKRFSLQWVENADFMKVWNRPIMTLF
jgi:hypothetical protein